MIRRSTTLAGVGSGRASRCRVRTMHTPHPAGVVPMNKCVLSLTVALALFGRVSAASAGPAVAAGSSHVVVLTDSGTVWAWGYNAYGQLGDGTTFTRVNPASIASTAITAIPAGGQSTSALKKDGAIGAWG